MSVAATFLEKARASANADRPLRLTVREFLDEWDAKKRGSLIVQEITEDLQEYGLTAIPPFTEPDMDDELEVVTAQREVSERTTRTKKSSLGEAPIGFTARQLLAAVPVDGSSIGGAALRSAVDLDDDRYAVALRELQRSGQIIVGPGRGGSIHRARTSEEPSAPTPAQEKKAEASLYEPFLQWLRSTWPPSLDEDEDTLRDAAITATPKGYRQRTGRWRRPDVTELRVYRYELLPAAQRIQLELSSYEVKPQGADLVEAVFEAASQARWAHRSTLVIETPDKEWVAADRIASEVRRFGLGLYYMTKLEATKSNAARYDVRVVLEPGLQSPDPADLQDAIGHFISLVPGLKKRYKTAIG